VSSWVQTEIVRRDKLRDRTLILKKFIHIATALYEMNNFNGVMEILSAVGSSTVIRLKKTWSKFEAEHPKNFQDYNDLCAAMSNDDGYKVLRKRIGEISPPCIPYLGTYLTELCMVEEGNSNTLDRQDLINFEKRRRQAYVIQELLAFQAYPYSFLPEGKIQTFLGLLEKGIEDQDSIYKLSIICEPREERKSKRLSLPLQEKVG